VAVHRYHAGACWRNHGSGKSFTPLSRRNEPQVIQTSDDNAPSAKRL